VTRRCYRTKNGDFLIDTGEVTDLSSIKFLAPDGSRLTSAGSFWLLDAAGKVKTFYKFTTTSDQEVLRYEAHRLVGGDLHELVCSWTDSQYGEEPPSTSDKVVERDLVPLDAVKAAPMLRGLDAAVAEYRRPKTSPAVAPDPRLLTSAASLPEIPGTGPIDFVLSVDSAMDLVLEGGGLELWREGFSYGRRERPRVLRGFVVQRYGARVRGWDDRTDYGD
jgi:hypothetical protein